MSATTSTTSPRTRLAAWSLVALMAAGSILMWLGVPLGLVFLVSQTVETTQPTFGPYLIVLVGVPVGMTLVGRWLGALDRRYAAVVARDRGRRQAAWLRSMRGERREERRWEVLDVVMIASVALALTTMGVWFLLFAGSSLPGG